MVSEGDYQGNPGLPISIDDPYYHQGQRRPRLYAGTAIRPAKLPHLRNTKMDTTMEKHGNFSKDESRMKKKSIRLGIIENNCGQIMGNKFLKFISILLFSLSFILSFRLLKNLLCPGISFGYNEMIIMMSSCLAVNFVALLILFKYQSLHDNLSDNLNNLIKQLHN